MCCDKEIVTAVYEASLAGTNMFNHGQREQTYWLFRGTLMVVATLLNHRPNLQARVKSRLSLADTMTTVDAAYELRKALDEIQHEIAPLK